jgi:hypothetical protein
MSIMAAPALETWKVKQGILAALNLDASQYVTRDAFVADALAKSKEEGLAKAAIGTEIHASLESYYKGLRVGSNEDIVYKVSSAIDDFCGPQKWVAEKEFFNSIQGYRYGGTCDLSSEEWVIDFKTKEELPAKSAIWDNHRIQLALYRKAINPTARCAICYVDYDGNTDIVELTDKDIDRGLIMGEACLRLWYASSW